MCNTWSVNFPIIDLYFSQSVVDKRIILHCLCLSFVANFLMWSNLMSPKSVYQCLNWPNSASAPVNKKKMDNHWKLWIILNFLELGQKTLAQILQWEKHWHGIHVTRRGRYGACISQERWGFYNFCPLWNLYLWNANCEILMNSE